MNLYLRLLCVMLMAWLGKKLATPKGISRLSFRVMPHDCDFNLHINNGRYLTLMDLGRFDLIIRTGLSQSMVKYRWTPLLSSAKIFFRREIRLWQTFELETRIAGWEGSYFVIEQRFMIKDKQGEAVTAAKGFVRGGFYQRKEKRFARVSEVFADLDFSEDPPEMADDVAAFLHASDSLKKTLTDQTG